MQWLQVEEVASWVRSLGWCDTGVGLSPMLTEAFNVISNVPGIILALIGFINAVHMRFEYRFKILHIVSIAVGLASLLLHCSLKVRSTTDSLALRLAHQHLLCFSCAIMIWGIDQKLCNRETTLPVHPFWHAVFHVLNGVNNYFGNMFLQYSRTRQLGLEPELRYVGGILPYVKVLAKNRRSIAIVNEENVQNDYKED